MDIDRKLYILNTQLTLMQGTDFSVNLKYACCKLIKMSSIIIKIESN